MSGSVILETKLVRPPVRSEHVVRGELLELLREGAARRLTLLTAPPGFGKTTLLAQWASAEEGRAVAWLSLDDADNDPTRFLAYLVESLRMVEPDIGGRALAAHSAPGAGPVDVVLPLLLNDAAALETGIVLVLDDYHVMEWRFAMTKLEHAARPEAKKVDLAATLATFDEPWSPRIVGRYNGNKIFLAKAKDEFVWHSHPETDDLFLVLEGRLTIQLRDGDVELGPGELFVVPHGVAHCPRSDEGASLLVIEPEATLNTGDPATAVAAVEF